MFVDVCQGQKMAEVRLVAGVLAEAKSLSSQQVERTSFGDAHSMQGSDDPTRVEASSSCSFVSDKAPHSSHPSPRRPIRCPQSPGWGTVVDRNCHARTEASSKCLPWAFRTPNNHNKRAIGITNAGLFDLYVLYPHVLLFTWNKCFMYNDTANVYVT